MKQKRFVKGTSVALLITMIATGCGSSVDSTSNIVPTTPDVSTSTSTSTPTPILKEDVTPKDVVKTIADDRVSAYQTYSKDGVAKKTFSSLYNAIAAVVDSDEYDFGSYITKLAGEDKNIKLFTKNARFASDSDDMFYFYQNGNQLASYTGWNATYWNDMKELGDITAVSVSPQNGTTPYFHSYELAGVSSTNDNAKTTQYWNVTQDIEANVIVNPDSYTGITKETYKINLKDAKIAPSKDVNQKTNAFVGFISADSYNVSNQGLRCDTATGDWYYYAGETPYNANSIEVQTDKCLLTSTWNEEGKYFVPDENVEMEFEILKLLDSDSNPYIINRLTMKFSSGRVSVRDYEIATLTQCGTVRFTAGLDVETETTQIDYMNGSYFKDLTITEAKGHALEAMQDPLAYGKIASLDTGVYDMLNSNPETAARFQTIIYNSGMISQDFSVAGKDVYNFEYTADINNSALDNAIIATNKKINELPLVAALTLENKEQLVAARNAYDSLESGEKLFVSAETLNKLKACEIQMLVLENPTLGSLIGKIISIGKLESHKNLAALVAKKSAIQEAFTEYDALSVDDKATINASTGGIFIVELNKALTENASAQIIIDLILTKSAGYSEDWSFDGTSWNAEVNKNTLQIAVEKINGEIKKLTAEELTTIIPVYVLSVINEKVAAASRAVETYNLAKNTVDKWVTTYSIDVTPGNANPELPIDVSSVVMTEIAEELKAIAEKFTKAYCGETWNFRNSVGDRTAPYVAAWKVLSKILEKDGSAYVYNTVTGFIELRVVRTV